MESSLTPQCDGLHSDLGETIQPKIKITEDGHFMACWNCCVQEYNYNNQLKDILEEGWHSIMLEETIEFGLQHLVDLACKIFIVALKRQGNVTTFFISTADIRFILRKFITTNVSVIITFNVETPFNPLMKAYEVFKRALVRRFDHPTGTMDLSNLENDTDLKDIIFMPLSLVSVMEKCFNMLRDMTFANDVRTINLSCNKIRDITNRGLKFEGRNLINLDLSSNEIANMSCLYNLTFRYKLQSINLDNNPICEQYNDGTTYLSHVQAIFKSIKTLDGIKLVDFPNTSICLHPFYTISIDAHRIVDMFLSSYFVLFDSPNRGDLLNYYGEHSLFSLTSNFDELKRNTKNSELQQYKNYHRNLLKISNMANYHKNGFKSAEVIVKVLQSLPLSDHDPLSFTVDVSYHENSITTVVITGVFRHNEEAVFRFSRTFTFSYLHDYGVHKFHIMNELLNVTCASENDIKNSFKELARKKGELNLFDPSDQDEEKLISIFCHLSGILRLYSRRRLVESKWDIKEALQTFIAQLKANKVPENNFKSLKPYSNHHIK